eukprot:scaffold1852_cov170-Amphora_coffeaeformis.AAC.1
MKRLVMNGNDSAPVEPAYPEGDNPSERDKAVWSKQYDQFLREQWKYNDDKAKVFTIVYGKCDKAMKNRIESQGAYASVEATNDVVGLLQLIKDAAYNSNKKKYPPMQAAMALKRLMMMRQYDNEDVVDYYKRFSSTLEMVDRAYGEITPMVLAQRDQAYKADAEGVSRAERNKMLAYMFMDGANKKLFGYFMKNMHDDYALGNDNYPTDVETALQVLLLYQEGTQKKTSKKETWVDEQVDLAFAQMTKNDKRKRGLCFKCGKKGHKEADCPEQQQQPQHTQTRDAISWMA